MATEELSGRPPWLLRAANTVERLVDHPENTFLSDVATDEDIRALRRFVRWVQLIGGHYRPEAGCSHRRELRVRQEGVAGLKCWDCGRFAPGKGA